MKTLMILVLASLFLNAFGQPDYEYRNINFAYGYYPPVGANGYPLNGCSDPHTICMGGPNFQTYLPGNPNAVTDTISFLGAQGCVSSVYIGAFRFSARNMNQGAWRRGDAMIFTFKFKKGVTYKISTSAEYWDDLYDPVNRNYLNRPTMQMLVTNNPVIGQQLCTVSAEPLDITSTVDPFVEYGATQSGYQGNNRYFNSYTFTATECYDYVEFSSKPYPNGESDGRVDLHNLYIETFYNLNISGSDFLCDGNPPLSYQVPGSQYFAVNWTVNQNPANIVNEQRVGKDLILTKVPNSTGFVTVTASISNSCMNTRTVQKQIRIGQPTMTDGTYLTNNTLTPLAIWNGDPLNNYNDICNLQNSSTSMLISGASSVLWTRTAASPSNTNWSQNGNDLNLYFWGVNQTAVFNVRATNYCGLSSYDFAFRSVNCGGGGGGGGCRQYIIAPNPVKGSINIIVPNIPPPCDIPTSKIKTEPKQITQVRIFDQLGNLKKSLKTYKAKQVNISASGLKPGIYLIEISGGAYIERQNIVVE